MRRIIEDLIQKKKQKRDELENSVKELIKKSTKFSFFKNKKHKQVLEEVDNLLNIFSEYMTLQDREWDAYSNNHSTMVFKSLQWKIEKLEAEYSNIKRLLSNFTALETTIDNLIKSLENEIDNEKLEKLRDIREELSVFQYSDFEKRFRGSEEDVENKLKKYVEHFNNVNDILDVGCGRGEFLRLLKENKKDCEGIDISVSMLKEAEEDGLNCKKSDAIEYLKSKDNASFGGIFSAQVIEHFKPLYLIEFVKQSFRVLKENGVIILETINPLSLFALSNIYFLDITHQKPLHPEYMRYLLETSGFTNVEIIYGEEPDERLVELPVDNEMALEFNTNVDKLNKILYSSTIYAVKGIKP